LADRVILSFDHHHDLLTGVYHAGYGKAFLVLNETSQELLWAHSLSKGKAANATFELAVTCFTQAFDDWVH